MADTYILIGGNFDGEIYTVTEEQETLCFPKYKPVRTAPLKGDFSTMEDFEIERYVRRVYHEGELKTVLYAHSSIESPLQYLMARYRPKRQGKNG